MSEAAEYFGFNEDEKDQKLGGWISAAFFAVGAPAAILVRLTVGRTPRMSPTLGNK